MHDGCGYPQNALQQTSSGSGLIRPTWYSPVRGVGCGAAAAAKLVAVDDAATAAAAALALQQLLPRLHNLHP